ncbi:MAG: peptide chain release factor N(5)-glutamine methyltransferase [Dehalococcoidia bacterium]|nr:peptide chain release factor N(5)-glutamine methyltransferase [Dehalococcoidia bacterium]
MAAETVSSLIRSITTRLSSVGIEDSGIDTRLLVRHAFGWSAEQQLGRLTDPAPAEQLELLESLVSRRVGREPLQYITGSAEFYRRRFSVDPRVLIPRPETEQLVVQAIEFVRERGIETPRVADICTGSGAVAISLALEMPAAEVVATDISAGALYVARQNAGSLGAEVGFFEGDLLDPLLDDRGRIDVIVSNPPYILRGAMQGLQAEVAREPSLALDGGDDGLDVIRPLFVGIRAALKPGWSAAYIEIDPPIAEGVFDLAKGEFPDASISLLTDLAGLTRCLAVENG